MNIRFRRSVRVAVAFALLSVSAASAARAQNRLCDPAAEDCRSILINYIRAEKTGIDVAFWFMEDARYTAELIDRFKAGVPVRVLVDSRANATNKYNADRLLELKNAGIPMRERYSGGILHWKMMLFAGQGTVEFSGANFSADAWLPSPGTPAYTNYTDESILFTADPSLVDSFRTRYGDLWTSTSASRDYANVPAILTRRYGTFPKDPQINYVPAESYVNRTLGRYSKETQQIDRLRNPNANAARRVTALAAPADYFEVTFTAEANVSYHLWIRSRADADYYANDSVFVQFSSVAGAMIGTTGAAEMNLEDCSGCRVSGWGWQDNGYDGLGPDIVFTQAGTQTIRIQPREDGLAIDQIVLSPLASRAVSPGTLKNDNTIFSK